MRSITGRISLLLDPELKTAFDAQLEADSLTKTEWLSREIRAYLRRSQPQLRLPGLLEPEVRGAAAEE